MTDPIVNLIRRFLPVSSRVGDLDWLGDTPIGPVARWPDLEDRYRVLVLADPGAGKTFEARRHAALMRERGQRAFFIRVEAIDAAFADAFEVGTAAEFDAWLAGTADGWFFLDSVDEAQLETPRALEAAIALFGGRIYDARERAHIYITSREDAWQALPDRTLIEQHLPHGEPPPENHGDGAGGGALRVFRLAPLNKNEIQLFAAYHGVTEPGAFLEAIDRGNLWTLAERPFDLRALISKWKADQTLGGRADMLQRLVALQLQALAGPDARRLLGSGQAMTAVRTLAAAVTMTGRNRLGLDGTTIGADRLDPVAFLPGWEAADIAALLRTGVFDDVVYGSVRFRHRDMRELLAAEYFQERLGSSADRPTLERLFFREIYGEEVIVPRLRPVLVWLLLSDATVRDHALALDPEIATEGGDPSQLPLTVRRQVIIDVVERIAVRHPSGSVIDNVAIARVAQPDLEDDVAALIERHADDDEAIFFLGRLVWQGRMAACLPRLMPIAAGHERGIYARIAAARAVLTIGSPDQRAKLWQALVEEASIDRRLFAEFVSSAGVDCGGVDLVLKALANLQPYERFRASGLSSALHDYVERLPTMADGVAENPLATLTTGINRLLDQEPYVERGECHVSEEYVWLARHGLHAVERLAASRSAAALAPAALALMRKFPALRYWRRGDTPDYKTKLADVVPRWTDLNDRLYWSGIEDRRRFVALRGEAVTDDRRIAFVGHFWAFGHNDFDRVMGWISSKPDADDRQVALSRAITLYFENDRPADWLESLRHAVADNVKLEATLEAQIHPTPSQQVLEWEADQARWEEEQREREERQVKERAAWIQMLKANPDRIRHPLGLAPGQFSSDQYHLMESIQGDDLGSSRSRGAHWEGLIPEFGEAVARAYRDAAAAHWRAFRPGLASEGANRSTVPYSLIFAMSGLEIEATENPGLFDRLSDEEVKLTLRYALYELNGFPKWFERLYRARPDLTRTFLWEEMRWELEHPVADQPMHYIVHDIVYHAPWLHAVIAPLLLDWLRCHDAPHLQTLRYALTILGGGDLADEQFASLAALKIESSATSLSDQPIWYAVMVGVDAGHGLPSLEAKLATLTPSDGTDFAEAFVVALLGGRRGDGLSRLSYRLPHNLKRLYVLMHHYIRADEDIERAGKGVYSPVRRDDAQDARNRLFTLMSEVPGEATYRAIKELEHDHPEESYRRWMTLRAHERAVSDADEPFWTLDQAIGFMVPA